jgi:hypothetical protein
MQIELEILGMLKWRRLGLSYLNNGMREELRTEFKRIMQVYEELLSEKNNRVTPAHIHGGR